MKAFCASLPAQIGIAVVRIIILTNLKGFSREKAQDIHHVMTLIIVLCVMTLIKCRHADG